jgi:hypothetical protein
MGAIEDALKNEPVSEGARLKESFHKKKKSKNYE